VVMEMTSVAGPRLACGLACECGEHRVFLIPFAYNMMTTKTKTHTLTINAIHITQFTVVFLYYHHRECVQLLVLVQEHVWYTRISLPSMNPRLRGRVLNPQLKGGC